MTSNTDKLKGQFLQGSIKKIKTPGRSTITAYNNNQSGYNFNAVSGFILHKKGAI